MSNDSPRDGAPAIQMQEYRIAHLRSLMETWHITPEELRDGATAPVPAAEQDKEQLQQAFERWMRANNPDNKLARADVNDPYDYVNAFTEAIWEGWRGAMLAAALPHAPSKNEVIRFLEMIAADAGNLEWRKRVANELLGKLRSGDAPSPPTGWQPEKDK